MRFSDYCLRQAPAKSWGFSILADGPIGEKAGKPNSRSLGNAARQFQFHSWASRVATPFRAVQGVYLGSPSFLAVGVCLEPKGTFGFLCRLGTINVIPTAGPPVPTTQTHEAVVELSPFDPKAVVTDDWGAPLPHTSVTVVEEAKTVRVTYRGEDGSKFRVNVVQRANPIGFHARLPGTSKR